VERTLREIAVEQGGMTVDAATVWLDGLVRDRRFRKDVY
jgi:sulfite reductase alpha subunit-like flavoprotein